jgi:hypothetical protein
MKKSIVTVVLVLALSSGCTDTVNYVDRLMNPPRFDSNEYGSLVDIRQLAEKVEACEDSAEHLPLARELQRKIDWAKKYSEFLPHNDDSFKMLSSLKAEADKFVEITSYATKKTSPTFCKLTLENISSQAVTIQKALASK